MDSQSRSAPNRLLAWTAPPLPDLGTAQDAVPDWVRTLDTIRRNHGIAGHIGGMDYRVGQKDVRAHTAVQNAIILNYGGGGHLDVTRPMWGGTGDLQFNYQSGDSSWRFNFQRRF